MTFLKDYSKAVIKEIYARIKEKNNAPNKGEHSTIMQQQTTKVEDIKTRLFLSHRRTTAQGTWFHNNYLRLSEIAGRLYENFNKDYETFLDSEAHFEVYTSSNSKITFC